MNKQKDDAHSKLSLVEKRDRYIVFILLGILFIVFLIPSFIHFDRSISVPFFIWLAIWISTVSVLITVVLISSNKVGIQLRNKASANALAIMGIDLLLQGKIHEYNLNQILLEVNNHLKSIGYPNIDYNTLKKIFEKNPTKIKSPKKDIDKNNNKNRSIFFWK